MTPLVFGPFRLDTQTQQLWREEQLILLRPRPFAVLQYLVEHAGQVVSSDAILKEVWAGTYVSKASLKVGIRAIREALGDDAEVPQYIETVGRVGYRFIAAVHGPKSTGQSQDSVVSSENSSGVRSPASEVHNFYSAIRTPQSAINVVGRDAELTQLHNLFAKTLKGERQLVFVTGEAGIGKTALVEAFVWSLESSVRSQEDPQRRAESKEQGANMSKAFLAPSSELRAPCFALGQCIEHYGPGEAYLPVLEAVGRLCRQADGERVVRVLQRVAPNWLLQLPALLSEAEQAALQQRVAGTSRERMLREIVEALEVLSAERPLVIVLEDLHWSDGSTIDLLNMMVRRREAARLLIIGTLRGMELIANDHPLKSVKQELVARGYATELALPYLSAAAVQTYVAEQLRTATSVETVATSVYQRTEGHALFMVQFTDYLRQRAEQGDDGGELGVPVGLRDVLEARIGRLSEDEQRVLEVGSVAGAEFVTASVAAGMKIATATVETICEGLARRGEFLDDRGVTTWPDGTVSGRYGFRHTLYQEVLSQRLGRGYQARLHQTIGGRLEQAYGVHAADIAVQLAVHFELGQAYARAVQYHYLAGQHAKQRSAYAEALLHLNAGLTLLVSLPDTAEHRQDELRLLMALAPVLQVTKGAAAVESAKAYTRALELAKHSGATEHAFVALFGLWLYSWMQGALRLARQQGELLFALAQREHYANAVFVSAAHRALGGTLYFLGEWLLARTHFEHALSGARAEQESFSVSFSMPAFGGMVPAYLACTLWGLGYAEQARTCMREASVRARDAGIAYDIAATSAWGVLLQQFLQEEQCVDEQSEQLLRLSATHGFPQWTAVGKIFQGWARSNNALAPAETESMWQAAEAFQASGARLNLPYFLGLLADAYCRQGNWQKGLLVVSNALAVVEETDQRFYEAELWRIKGELVLASIVRRPVSEEEESQKAKGKSQKSKVTDPEPPAPDPQGEADAYFLKAIAIAHQQQAKSFELRAVVSLVRLRQQQALAQGAESETARKQEGEEAGRPEERFRRPASQLPSARLNEAHQMLSEVYNWFTEGFDTKDLQEARTLLESLGV